MKIKVCGMTREEDIELAASLGAWAVGLILVPSSPRALNLEKAARLRRAVPKGVLSVGVFQDAPRESVLEAVVSLKLDAVQLHGSESPDYCRGFPCQVFKAFGVTSRGLPAIAGYAVDGVLIEPARSEEDRRLGRGPDENARQEAWRLACALKGEVPMLILAGGLNGRNVAEAVRIVRPAAVDVSSGVESAPGVKDSRRLRQFFRALKDF